MYKNILISSMQKLPFQLKSFLWRGAWKIMRLKERQDLAAGYSLTSMELTLHRLKANGFSPSGMVDVGAFRGEWTRMALRAFAGSDAVMLEAQEGKREALERLAASRPNVYVEMGLVGRESRDKVLFYEMETGSSIYEEQSQVPRDVKLYGMRTLDAVLLPYVEKLGGWPALVKLDVQGAELDILHGAPESLRHAEVLILEMSLIPFNRGAPPFATVFRFLDEQGFRLYDIASMIRRPLDDALAQIDAVFIRKDSPLIVNERFN